MENKTTIKCPECGSKIDVNDILKHQIEDSIRKEFQEKQNKISRDFQARNEQFLKDKKTFEEQKARENELFQERLEKGKREAAKLISLKVKAKLEEEQKENLLNMENELKEKSEKLKELYKKDAEISKLQREKLEIKELTEAQAQKKLNELLLAEKNKIVKQEDEKNELKFKELHKQLDDQRKLTAEMKRKQEQGSTQLQGEVQELGIEEWLATNFPLDTIEEIKKGANGADCLQCVNTREQQNCGTIYYESKRAKNFQPAWIGKFKNDIRDNNANVGVLVTEVLPQGMERMGMRDGIWICTYQEFKALSAVLRQSVIKINAALASQVNKGDKMEMLYDFLTSNEFKLQIEGIVEGFTQMQTDLNKEKNAMQRIWKQREKQIDKVTANTINMYGSIKGIAGNAIQNVKALELENTSEEESVRELE